MENLDTTRKTEGKKESGKIYVLIHICGSEHFLNAFNTLIVQGRALRQIFKSESERKSCSVTVVCDSIQTIAGLHVALC